MAGDEPQPAWQTFSLVTGGPFYRLLQRLRLVGPAGPEIRRPSLAAFWVALGPVLTIAALEASRTGHLDPLLADFSVFARFIVAVPLFFAAEYALHVRGTSSVQRFVVGGFAGDEGATAIEHALHRAERLRDLGAVELAIAVAAVFGGQSSLWQWTGFAGYVQGAAVDTARATAAQVWYSLVALPLFQFLLARWLWRWLIWSGVLLALSRLKLRLLATHPDHAGGIASLADPMYAFAVFIAGASAVVAAAWATRFAQHGSELKAHALPCALLLLIALAVAVGPLLAFWPTMVRSRFNAIREYSRLALVHGRMFHHRWIEGEIDSSVLGSPDISSLTDLQQAYGEMMRMRSIPFGMRPITTIALCVLTPMLPLAAFEVPVDQLLLTIVRALVPGLP